MFPVVNKSYLESWKNIAQERNINLIKERVFNYKIEKKTPWDEKGPNLGISMGNLNVRFWSRVVEKLWLILPIGSVIMFFF